ncbi:MAG: hypothetical protein GY749_29460 [Desulfobacteraceae bacterium]|nr:hypothetical protein [Desulfobacteraceae bacterium]
MKTLSVRQMQERRLEEEETGTEDMPDEGWDCNVGESGLAAWKPDLKRYSEKETKLLERELDRQITTAEKAEETLRAGTDALESETFHRIDLLRDQVSENMAQSDFDFWIKELARDGTVELTGGDTSEMGEDQIGKLVTDSEIGILVNLVFTD